MKKHLKRWGGLLLALVVLLVVGRLACGPAGPDGGHDHAMDTGEEVWTCPMHPQIRLPDPGPCPICGMDLVPIGSGADEDERHLVLSPAARRLARVATAPVERRFVTKPVRMVGKVDFDETAMKTISAWVPGRLDRLFVDYTGVRVEQGDHLVWLYSPALLTAQEELLGARKRLGATAGEASEFLAASNRRAYEAARQKLVLWGLTEAQVDEIEARGTAEDHVMLTSPSSGIVVRKELDQGAYVEVGTRIYSIADLSHLWVRLDAYEQDLPWLRFGQDVRLETEAYPGETFEGRISFIDPIVNERTRTVKVRVNVDNPDGRLKPGMFVRAVAAARVGSAGSVVDSSLAGKWISPMHPEIVKDGPGECDVCGMDLVPAERLGLVDAGDDAQAPLVVPATAVLVTGQRGVVYVELPPEDPDGPVTYEGREVVLGPRAGDVYLVRSGLEEGERVVVNGAFRIDSSMQIRARPSMMSMGRERTLRGDPGVDVLLASLEDLYVAYLALQEALAADDVERAQAALTRVRTARASAVPEGLSPGGRAVWAEVEPVLDGALASEMETDLAALRVAFDGLSRALIRLADAFGSGAPGTVREVLCPMAFDDRGARWLQRGEAIANPYFGDEMLRCGEVVRTHGADEHAGHDHGSGAAHGGGR